ncbi:response regulator transcription factor [Actinomadura viridis]|uniref:DNA-binding NarL/FixJ family response regulator n=1 Tax=Actinomadura viridis TaxID=58110 RepID=A0A931DM80_9ACTN|nr:response regulator transcription factor [Actinomadura viridis]MBG6092545.1 DNA-binding NarL/FixJ family response regulator [Actinomadura viridis]
MPSGDGPIRVVIADDERVVRDGLRAILETQEDIIVAGTAVDGHDALRLCAPPRPDVLLLDVRMPGLDGLQVLAALAGSGAVGPDGIGVVMLTTFDMDDYIQEALTRGAGGFLLKTSSYEELLIAVRAAAAGEAALSPSVARRVIGGYVDHHRALRAASAEPAAGARPADPALARLHDLTPREHDVLGLLAEGLSNQDIATRLRVSKHTVKSHVSRILTKLGLRSRGQAAALARRHHP